MGLADEGGKGAGGKGAGVSGDVPPADEAAVAAVGVTLSLGPVVGGADWNGAGGGAGAGAGGSPIPAVPGNLRPRLANCGGCHVWVS